MPNIIRDPIISGDLVVSGNSNLAGNLNIAGETNVSGDLNMSGNSIFNGNTQINGEINMDSNMDMNNNRIINIGNPINNLDAVNKKYVDHVTSGIDPNIVDLSVNTINYKDSIHNINGTFTIDGSGNITTNGNITTHGITDVRNMLTGNINLQGNRILNIASPELDSDLTTKSYVENAISNKLDKTGDTMSGVLNMEQNKITNVATPTDDKDVATKYYVDHAVTGNGGGTADLKVNTLEFKTELKQEDENFTVDGSGNITTNGNINLNGTNKSVSAYNLNSTNEITLSNAAFRVTSASNRSYIQGGETSAGQTGVIRFSKWENSDKVIDIDTSNNILDVDEVTIKTKNYADLDTQVKTNATDISANTANISDKLSKGGGIMSGVLNMNGQKITNVGTPTDTNDVATKTYVDNAITGIDSGTADLTVDTLTANTTVYAKGHVISQNVGETITSGIYPLFVAGNETNTGMYGYLGTNINGNINPVEINKPNQGLIFNVQENNNKIPAMILYYNGNVRIAPEEADLNAAVQDAALSVAGNSSIGGNLLVTENISAKNILVTGDISVNGDLQVLSTLDVSGNKITNVGTPTDESDAANKSYVDIEISKINTSSSSNYPTDISANTITTTGSVTIGEDIDVKKDARINGYVISQDVGENIESGTYPLFVAGNETKTGMYGYKAYINENGAQSNVNQGLIFNIQDNNEKKTAMTLYHNGNVGIGTESPDATLDVNGECIIGGSLFVNNEIISQNIMSNTEGSSTFAVVRIADTDCGLYGSKTDNNNYGLIMNVKNDGQQLKALDISSNGNVGIDGTTFIKNKVAIGSGFTDTPEIFGSNVDGDIQIGSWVIDGGTGSSKTSGLYFKRTDSLDTNMLILNQYGISVDGSVQFPNNWNIETRITSKGDFIGFYKVENGTPIAFIIKNSKSQQLNFTGQHRTLFDSNHRTNVLNMDPSLNTDISENILQGFIVSSTGRYVDNLIEINEAIPYIEFSNSAKDKRVYGVLADAEDISGTTREFSHGAFTSSFDRNSEIDHRVSVNSIGEGAIWVCNMKYDGSDGEIIENGDYITASPIPGIGMLQTEEYLAKYTVAKATTDCSFNGETTSVRDFSKNPIAITNENGEQVLDQYESGRIKYVPVIENGEYVITEVLKDTSNPGLGTVKIEKFNEKVIEITSTGYTIYNDDTKTEEFYQYAFDFANGTPIQQAIVGKTFKMAFIGCTYHCG